MIETITEKVSLKYFFLLLGGAVIPDMNLCFEFVISVAHEACELIQVF